MIKFQLDRTIERYKTRLVTNEYTKTYGIDFFEIFSNGVKLSTIRIIIFLVAYKD